ncbi:MAG: glucose-6-phosphate isomerase [Deltaproteobacteria bacterium]|nr:glucose-6-phosphate isomerase [Deltaproteobacteria bacterium]
MTFKIGPYQDLVDKALAEIKDQRVLERIWAHDHTVWKPEATEIANRLGWLNIAEAMGDEVQRLQEFAAGAREDGYTHALLLGMGGSSLAPEVFRTTFGVQKGYLDLDVLDSTDPAAVAAHAERLDPKRTLFIVSTKSGTTVETLSFFKFFYNWTKDAIGEQRAGDHFIAITDPGSSLVDLAEQYHFREIFLNDSNIGGRYAALSYVGLVPAALIGMDIALLLKWAIAMADHCKISNPQKVDDTIAARLGVALGEMAKGGRDKVTFVISSQVVSFGDWLEQLIAESTGKEGQGILPVVGEAVGAPETYGADRLFVYLCEEGDTADDAAVTTLERSGHPIIRISLHDRYDLGAQCFLWEMAVAVACNRLGVNPFNQPNVEAAKTRARQAVDEYKEKGTLPVDAPTLTDGAIAVYGVVKAENSGAPLAAFLSQAEPDAYVALQAYVQPTAEIEAALQGLRTQVRDRFKLATTLGYGPRFLHSTGQLHKGDAGRGLFVQITADDPKDIPIPDAAGSPDSSLTFGTLKTAQAHGDRQALLDAGRQVIRFHLGRDAVKGLKALSETVS